MVEIKVGEYLGSGFEIDCSKEVDVGGQETGNVVQRLNKRGKLWQHDDAQYLERCLDLLRDETSLEVGEDVKVLSDVVLAAADGTRKAVKSVRLSKFESDFDQMVMKYRDIKQGGAQLLRKIMAVIRDGYELREKHQVGLDPMGADLVMDVLKGVPQYMFLRVADLMPSSLQSLVRFRVRGIEGKARNILLRSGQLECKDIGLQDLSDQGRMRWLMKHYNSFTFAGLIELVRMVNRELEAEGREIVDWKDIEGLPCKAGKMHRLVARKLFKMMKRLFEQYELRRELAGSGKLLEDRVY